MLAKEGDGPFDDSNWLFEIKWDGYRAIAEVNKREVSLYSRNGNTFNASYPLVVEALQKLNLYAVLDGEVTVTDEEGNPSFQLIQNYDGQDPIFYYVFDILEYNGKSLVNKPLEDRKELLKKVLKQNEVIKYSDHILKEGNALYDELGRRDMEGMVAKRRNSLYYPGVRTTEWLKIKHHKTLEAVICGFTEPRESRKHFGALVLGIFDKGELKYVGHTGSGFNDKSLKEMSQMLEPLVSNKSPFNENVKTNMPVTWVRPQLVCEIKYTEWTNDGHLRHPIFLHLRTDKKPKEVTMASAKPVNKNTKSPSKTVEKPKKAIEKTGKEKQFIFGKIKINISHPDKVFWPDEGITKGNVADYYQSVADYILPYLKDRPQSLYRTPNGILSEGFFHKDAGEEAPVWVKSIPVFSESANKDIDYIICNNAATMAYLNNLGCIELNPWNSTIKKMDNPDYLILDIDPSKNNSFDQVIEAAQVIHEILEKAQAANFCKTSGATGLHIYVPLEKKYTYEQAKDFAHVICTLAHEQLPGFTSLERNLKKRGDSHIYLDYLQNRRGQTIACAYSLRPKPGAPVSMPLEWKEVKTGLSPRDFNIHNALTRIKKKGDLFSRVLGKGIDMAKCLERLEE